MLVDIGLPPWVLWVVFLSVHTVTGNAEVDDNGGIRTMGVQFSAGPWGEIKFSRRTLL